MLCFFLVGAVLAQNVKKVTVKSEIKGCWVALIHVDEIVGKEYGWWSVWHEYKKAKKYKPAPATFTNVPQGKYVVVVYNPASQFKQDGDSDGAVMEEVDIQKNIALTFKKAEFKTWHCLSCPWLYLWNGEKFVKHTEVIKDVVGKLQETTTQTSIAQAFVVHNTLKIRIQEEKDEISYLNRVVLKVGEQTILPENSPESLIGKDKKYYTLRKGEAIELTFVLPTLSQDAQIVLETTGYYEPEKEFLSEIYQKYLRNK